MIAINLPNRLTLFRIFVAPLIVLLLISPDFWACFAAALIFALAAITDWLDGHLARVTNQVTILGKLLDPIADKLLVMAALIPLVELGRVSAWMVAIIIGREFAVSGLRMVAATQGVVIAAGMVGKYKMGAEITAILFLILDFNPLFHFLGQFFIGAAMLVSLYSGADYFIQCWGKIDHSDEAI